MIIPFGFMKAASSGGGGDSVPTTNLILDLDAAQDVYSDYSGTTAIPNNSTTTGVAHWGDQSSYTYTGNPMSARMVDSSERPIWKPSDSNRNNKPYLSFDGSDRYMVMEPYSGAYNINGGSSGNGGSTGKTGITVYMVVEMGNQDYDGGLINKNSDFYQSDGWGFWANSSENIEAFALSDGYSSYNDIILTNQTSNGAAAVLSYTLNSSDTESLRRNSMRVKQVGSSVGIRFPADSSTTKTTDLESGFTFPNEKVLIGCLRNTSGNANTLYTFDGKMFRVLMYHESHDASTQESIMNTLGTIYNI
jgi:hypothetical protein